jgi:iron complex outermembrane receptor protein
MSNRSILGLSTALMSAGAFVGAAIAQETEAPRERESIDTIVVTATKREQTIIEAPISVSVVTEETIAKTGATNFEELQTLLPTVVFSNSQSPVQSNVGIRGVSTAGGSAALEPSVGIYVDGVFTDRTAFGIGDFNDIARVEVLRGPQATVFGNSSPAGIINFVTKNPEDEFSGDFRVTLGNFDRRQVSGTVTGPLIDDVLNWRVSGFVHKRDGYLENLLGPDANDQNSFGIRTKFDFVSSDTFNALLTLEYSETDQNCCVPVLTNVSQATIDRFATASTDFPYVGDGVAFPLNQVEDQVVAVDGRNQYQQDLFAAVLDLSWDIGEHELISVSSYRGIDQFSRTDIDFTGLDLLDFPSVERTNEQISQEIRLVSPSKSAFTYLLGAYYFEKEVEEDSGLVINEELAGLLGGNILPAFSPSGSKINNKNYALFGEGTLDLNAQWSITGGLRYNYDDKEIEAFASRLRADGSELSPTQTIPEEFQQRDGGELTGKFVVAYDWLNGWNSFASYTRGYKAFGINDDANLQRNIPGASFFFDSEIVDNYEVGTKGRVDALNTTLSIVAFRTEYSDFQSLSSFTDENDQLRFFLQNAASLTSQGVEADWASEIGEHWSFSGGLTYLNAEFDDYPDAEGPNGPLDLTGEPLRDAPDFSGSFVLGYDRPITSSLRLFAQTDAFHRTEVFTDQNLDPLEVQEAYTKYNARLGVGGIDGGWTLEVWGRNLSDEITFGRAGSPLFGAVTGLLPFAGAAPFPNGDARTLFTGEPRTWGVTATVSF